MQTDLQRRRIGINKRAFRYLSKGDAQSACRLLSLASEVHTVREGEWRKVR